MIVALVPRIGGTQTLFVGLHRLDFRNGLDNFVARQEMKDRMEDPAGSGPIDELVVICWETPEELLLHFGKLIGPGTETGTPA